MQDRRIARKKAIIRRRIFFGGCALVLALLIALIIFIVKVVVSESDDSSKKESSAVSEIMSSQEKETVSSGPTLVKKGDYLLDADYTNLLLVNAQNPLPDSYDRDVRENLVEIDEQYRNNDNVTQIHKDVYPYIVAMVADAQKDGVDLRVWSPFRSYAIQKDLFNKQVARVGGDEVKAATVVARPGTSEHNTGLCADFNMASDTFETTKMYEWLVENAAEYGFIMRYSADKQDKTGVIHESWHWRFVGIKAAKQMNTFGMCLEEYVEYLDSLD